MPRAATRWTRRKARLSHIEFSNESSLRTQGSIRRGLSLRHVSRGLFSLLRPGVMGPCVRSDDLLRDCTRPRINVRLNSVICDSPASERGSNFARIAKSELRPAFFLTQQQVDRIIFHLRRPSLGTKCVRAVSRLLFMASLLAGTGGSNGYRLYFSFNRAIASVPSSGGSAAVFLRRGWTARIYLRRRRRCLKRDTCYAPRRLEAGQGRGCHWISA